ncbi:MAG: Coenzyme F420 hydrogenase/dehydrogenase, beta subunit C-terminal domain [Dehalococcoidia bacterium]|nr:Coenzyme F420 hydrogenase/dehydrogenase, beta subunit C-terminal domain [Dehalococcoidia bacterium]
MKNASTIEPVVRAGLCTGCGTCVGICPKDAVHMVMDRRKGLYVPALDRDKCNECGLCLDACPGPAVDFRGLNLDVFSKEPEDNVLGNYLNCYIGHAADHDTRYGSASGGLVTALLAFALEEGIIDGALVTRMNRDRPLEPEPFIARTREEIVSASGSKYCPVPANIALRHILREEGRFAVVGLPCHLHGVRKAEVTNKALKRKIVLHLGLLCGHSDTFMETQFILKQHGIRPEDVVGLNYRGSGWPGSMNVRLSSGAARLIPYEDYINLHALRFFTPMRCHSCVDQISGLSDISFMDAWLPEVIAQDKVGTSIIVSRSPASEMLCRSAGLKAAVELEPVGSDAVLRSQGRAVLAHKDVRAHFWFLRLSGSALPEYGAAFPRSGWFNYLRVALAHSNARVSAGAHLRRLVAPLLRLEVWFFRRLESKM